MEEKRESEELGQEKEQKKSKKIHFLAVVKLKYFPN